MEYLRRSAWVWHELAEEERAEARPLLGEWVPMHLPEFVDTAGEWLSPVAIASSVW